MSTPPRIVRTAWRRLTSMRTALILLFLLAVAAVPGSLLPQRNLNPIKVSDYIKDHGAWGRFLDRIDMFDVFGAPWFAAIYLLLFVSLIGCLIPRIRVHARAMGRAPLPAPRNLERLPESGRFETAVAPAAYASAARTALGRRWRVAQRTEDSGALTVSAEKGYSRETGNLLFHVALLVALVLIAVGQLYKYQSDRVLVQGDSFCADVRSQLDSWQPGRFAAEGKVAPAPICIDLHKFVATYTASGEPSQFAAQVGYRAGHDAPTKADTIEVNHPLRIDGDRVYLISHGFAPRITVRFPDGSTQTDTEAFAPTNPTTYYSEGAFKLNGKDNHDIGISGFFAPSPTPGPGGKIVSSSPKARNPILGISVYTGDINPTGQPESVYSLDTTNLKKAGQANLTRGKTAKLPGGIQVTFDGWVPTASLQVSHDPAQGYLLFAAVAMVLGLGASLGIRRRRVWVRIAPARGGGDRSPTVVSVGGLARSDAGNFATEFAELLERLRAASAPHPAASGSDGAGADPRRFERVEHPIGADTVGSSPIGSRGD